MANSKGRNRYSRKRSTNQHKNECPNWYITKFKREKKLPCQFSFFFLSLTLFFPSLFTSSTSATTDTYFLQRKKNVIIIRTIITSILPNGIKVRFLDCMKIEILHIILGILTSSCWSLLFHLSAVEPLSGNALFAKAVWC